MLRTLIIGSCVLGLAVAVTSRAEDPVNTQGGVAQEMKRVEETVREPESAPTKVTPDVSYDAVQAAADKAKAAAQVTNAPASEPSAETPVPLNAPATNATAPAEVGITNAAALVVPPSGGTPEPSAAAAPEAAAAPAAAAPAAAALAAGLEVTRLEIRGDASVLDRSGLRKPLEADTVGKSLDEEQVAAIAKKYQAALQKAGYYIARVWAPVQHWNDGTLIYIVDAGRIGKISLYKREGVKTVPYHGRWYSERQIQNRLRGIKPGTIFSYSDLYGTVYAFNAHPDLTTDVDLTVRKEGEGDDQRRYVDMDFEVKESRPFHATLELANNGTDISQEWHAGLTLQYLNVSQHDDVITLNAPASLDLSTIHSTALSYYRPYSWKKGGGISVFGGYSDLSAKNVEPGIDLKGKGWFAGAQGSYNLIDDAKRLLSLSLGLSHSVIDNTIVLPDGQESSVARSQISPIALTLSWVSKQPDRRNGRTQLNWTTEINHSGFLGASDDAELDQQRANAKADYIVEKLQIARVQPILGHPDRPADDWTLYTRLAAQYATEPLIPGEQMGLGGQNTVRGYIENEVLADNGVVFNVEFRTPVRHSSRIPRWMKDDPNDRRYQDFEGVQYVLFADAAYATLNDNVSGQDSSYTLVGVGPGARFSIGKSCVARADWGFPLQTTKDSSSSGRGNFSIQFQF